MDLFCGLFLPLQGDDDKQCSNSGASADHQFHNLRKLEDDYVDPFCVYNNNKDGYYHWPDLYSEITEMLEPCILVLAIAELRRQARQGDVALSGKPCLKTPFTHRDVMKVIEMNRKQLEKETNLLKKYAVKDVLRAATERNMMKFRDASGKERAARSSQLAISNDTILVFDDHQYENKELVYMIEVNVTRKRITVCFRSSTTKTDWATNLELYMKEIKNPLYQHDGNGYGRRQHGGGGGSSDHHHHQHQHHHHQPPTLRVHHGFHDYLFQPTERGVQGPNGEPLSEYQEIFQEHLFPILKKYPGYKVSRVVSRSGESVPMVLVCLYCIVFCYSK
jgi:hypothetical protein